MFKLQASTELMKSHKAAQVLADQSAFRVLQTSDGLLLFFGVSDSGVLYLTAEQTTATGWTPVDLTAEQTTATGWTPVDLTTELAKNFPGKTIVCKSFAAGQDATQGAITLAQIVHVTEDNSDHLFVLADLPDQSGASWMQPSGARPWVACPFDGASAGALAYVAIPVSSAPYVLAGVVSPVTRFIQNYTVNLTASSGVWTPFPTAENFDTLNDMASGQPAGAMFPGIYQLTQLSGEASLTFNPWRGLFGPPDVTKLTAPTGATSLATAPGNGGTDLYVAGEGAVYLFPAGVQKSLTQGIQIFSDPNISNVDSLHSHVSGAHVTVWGRTNAGVVFYSRCEAGNQSDPSAWSAPIPLLTGVDQLTTLLDLSTGTSVLFTHTSGQQIVQLNQDPVTTEWRSKSILLPALGIKDVVEFYTHTTRIEAVDDNQLPVVGQTFKIRATSPCAVYVEDVYVRLSPSVSLDVTTDGQGSVTIVQETDKLAAVCYNLVQGDGSVVNVNPMTPCLQKMSAIQNGTDLSNIQVTNEDGQTSPLVDSQQVSAASTNAVAHGIAQFVKATQALPQNGSVQGVSGALLGTFDSSAGEIWGMKFGNEISYFEGSSQLTAAGIPATMSLKGGDWIEAWAGDIWKWLEHTFDVVKKFFVQVVDGVTHFFIEIGDKLYHFIMKCIADVAHGIQFILHAIKVGFEKLVQWVGFIFSWEDIITTHKVLKNMILCYANYAIEQLPAARTAIQVACQNLENLANQWAGLPTTGNAGELAKSNPRPKGSDSPASHYGVYHAKNSGGSATTTYSPPNPSGSKLEQLVEDLYSILKNEENDLTSACEEFKTQVIDNFTKLSPAELGKKLLAIIFDLIIKTAENVLTGTIDIISVLADGVVSALNHTLEIPVLSWLYEKLVGEPLSFLDLVCLITAIPVTIIVKLVSDEAPFPAGDFTSALLKAQTFEEIRSLYHGQRVMPDEASAGSMPMVGATPSVKAIAKLNRVGGIVGGIGSAAIIVFGILKAKWPSKGVFSVMYAASFLLYIGPDWIGQISAGDDPPDYVTLNTFYAAIATVKTFADISLCYYEKDVTPKDSLLYKWNDESPLVECVFNCAWQAPVTVAYLADPTPDSSKVGLAGNTAFNFGGVLAPGMASKDPKIALGFLIACSILSGIYGALMVAQGELLYHGK
jgi:hypothetical protein